MDSCAKRLRHMRKKHGFTQKEISSLLAISQSTYSSYERGEYDIPAWHLLTLSKIYRTSVDYFLGLDKYFEK